MPTTDSEILMQEPRIEINGCWLSPAQAMAVRVACETMLLQMKDPDALGTDCTGRAITKGYRDRLREVMPMMARLGAEKETAP